MIALDVEGEGAEGGGPGTTALDEEEGDGTNTAVLDEEEGEGDGVEMSIGIEHPATVVAPGLLDVPAGHGLSSFPRR